MRPVLKAKVLIVHHAPLIRAGLAGLIDTSDRFTVCAQDAFAVCRPQQATAQAVALAMRQEIRVQLNPIA
jgi:hypothetical protein